MDWGAPAQLHRHVARAWILEQAEFHPAWQATRELLPAGRLEELLDELIDLLAQANTDPNALRFTGAYAIARVGVER